MIKNVALKVFLQNTVFSVFSIVNKRLNHDKRKIILYSNLGFRDNVKALYDYIVESEYNEKYQIVCSTNDYKKFSDVKIPNVRFVSNVRGILEYFTAGAVYYCFGKIPILPGRGQEVVQMWHGSPYKGADEGMLKGHSFERQYYTRAFSTSRNFAPIWAYNFSMPLEHITICGHPRCDALYKESPNYDFGEYKKIVLWAPTFRKSSVTGYSDTKSTDKLVPVIDNNDFEMINSKLKEIGVKIIVKLHPLQDLNEYNLVDMDYFVLMSHVEFLKRKMDLYRFMVQCDALITDYSSIFYDFLLLNRPMAFTEDDMEDYADTRGYSVDDPVGYKPGFRIKSTNDLLKFATDLANGVDDYRADRDRVMDLTNDYRDGQFCNRALECVGLMR